MYRVRGQWTDERLDDLNQRVSDGFDRVDRNIRDLRTDMDARFGEVNGRLDSMEERFDARFDALHRLLIRAAGGVIAVLLTTGAGLVATQL
jgi:tetrahydromethanopterin S-methyltransferase subunit G